MLTMNFFYSVDESSFLRPDLEEKLKLDKQDSVNPTSTLTSPKSIRKLPTKSYVESLHESSRNRRDLSSVFNDQDKRLIYLDGVTVNRSPSLDNELANKMYVDDSIGEENVLRFNQTLENFLKVSFGNDVYNLTKYDKIQVTDTIKFKYPKTSGCLLPN